MSHAPVSKHLQSNHQLYSQPRNCLLPIQEKKTPSIVSIMLVWTRRCSRAITGYCLNEMITIIISLSYWAHVRMMKQTRPVWDEILKQWVCHCNGWAQCHILFYIQHYKFDFSLSSSFNNRLCSYQQVYYKEHHVHILIEQGGGLCQHIFTFWQR